MPLLLTILSVLAAVAFVAVLMMGLLLIFKLLQSVQRYLQQIAMGVRAIEQQLIPFADRGVALAASVEATGQTLRRTADSLSTVDRSLDSAATALKAMR